MVQTLSLELVSSSPTYALLRMSTYDPSPGLKMTMTTDRNLLPSLLFQGVTSLRRPHLFCGFHFLGAFSSGVAPTTVFS